MRITSKGQVTVPKHIRDKLGIGPGDDIGFREEGQAVIVEKVEEPKKVNKGLELAKHLLGKGPMLRQGRPLMTAEEVTELMRGRAMNASDID
jgi:AbrB family looped-hinge helix DNA binding protein